MKKDNKQKVLCGTCVKWKNGEVNCIRPGCPNYIKMQKKDTKQIRKETPVYSGVLKYFPRALRYVSQVSLAGNKQHLNGQALHWDKTKSMDQEDALIRHLLDVAEGNEVDDDGILHRGKVAWRALASLEIYLEELNK